MEQNDIILIVCSVILLIGYIIYTKETFTTKFNTENNNITTKDKINNNFIDVQYEEDYYDFKDAIWRIQKEQNKKFNKKELPLIVDKNINNNNEITKYVNAFIKQINNIILENKDNKFILNGWQTSLPEREYIDGWEQHLENLGLPPSLYSKPTTIAPVKLININEIKYSVYMVIQKINTEKQLVVKLVIVINKKTNMKYIEDVQIIGALVNYNKGTNREKYNKFKNITTIKEDALVYDTRNVINETIKHKKYLNDR